MKTTQPWRRLPMKSDEDESTLMKVTDQGYWIQWPKTLGRQFRLIPIVGQNQRRRIAKADGDDGSTLLQIRNHDLCRWSKQPSCSRVTTTDLRISLMVHAHDGWILLIRLTHACTWRVEVICKTDACTWRMRTIVMHMTDHDGRKSWIKIIVMQMVHHDEGKPWMKTITMQVNHQVYCTAMQIDHKACEKRKKEKKSMTNEGISGLIQTHRQKTKRRWRIKTKAREGLP